MAQFIDASGLQIPTIEDLLLEVSEEQRAEIDALLATQPTSLVGQFNGIEASSQREAWEAIQVAFSAVNPNNSEGAILDGVCSITGTIREKSRPSKFSGSKKIVVNIDDGTTVTAGVTAFSVSGRPDIVFTIVADDRFVDGEFTNTTGVTDNFEFEAVCTQNGPIAVNAGTLIVIATPTFGLNFVSNPFDAIIGANVELDEPLRTRREDEIRQQGGSTPPALKADLEAYTDEDGNHPIRSAVVIDNDTDSYDAFGTPPHSFHTIIWDGPGQDADDDAVTAIVRANKPSGIAAIGTLGSGKYKWDRAPQRSTEIEVTLKFVSGAYAGDAAVKTAIAAAFEAVQKPSNGEDELGIVAYSRQVGAALKVQGVSRVTLTRLRFVGGSYLSNTDLTPSVTEVAVTDTSLITVISSAE